MKRLQLFVATLLLMALTNACVQNIEGVDTSLGYTTITVGMPESRTSLGAKDENSRHLHFFVAAFCALPLSSRRLRCH